MKRLPSLKKNLKKPEKKPEQKQSVHVAFPRARSYDHGLFDFRAEINCVRWLGLDQHRASATLFGGTPRFPQVEGGEWFWRSRTLCWH